MPTGAMVLAALGGVLIAALAVYLIVIAVLLRRIRFTLGTLIVGLRAIAYATEQLGPDLERLNAELGQIEGALGGLSEDARTTSG